MIDVAKSKQIAAAFNQNDNYDAFRIRLDLLDISIEDAELAWQKVNSILVEELMKGMKFIVDDKVSFAKLFEDKRWLLPFSTKIENIQDENYLLHGQFLSMKMLSRTGNVIETRARIEYIEDLHTMHGIDIWKEVLCNALAECAVQY